MDAGILSRPVLTRFTGTDTKYAHAVPGTTGWLGRTVTFQSANWLTGKNNKNFGFIVNIYSGIVLFGGKRVSGVGFCRPVGSIRVVVPGLGE